jgi:hypothetical protein
MDMDALFTFELFIVVVVIAVIAGGAVYRAVHDRRIRRETGREVGTADVPVGTGPNEPATSATGTAPRRPLHEFYKSMGLETKEDMKVRLYSIHEYRDDLGGTRVEPNAGFVAALKAYRQLDDEWYDYSPRKAADVLDLTPEDYEIDEERSAILLKRLPPGLPQSARDVL